MSTVTLSELRSVRVADALNGWQILMEALETPIGDINNSLELVETLIRLAILADEASVGVGIDWDLPKHGSSIQRKFLSIAELALIKNRLQSFCWEVPCDVLCVLGKQHTPQKGATFRSLSHHLALYQPNEIEARWVNPVPKTIKQGPARETLNLLLLPWPTRVETDAFREIQPPGARGGDNALQGYFAISLRNANLQSASLRSYRAYLRPLKSNLEVLTPLSFPS